jgi:hypothetical protein
MQLWRRVTLEAFPSISQSQSRRNTRGKMRLSIKSRTARMQLALIKASPAALFACIVYFRELHFGFRKLRLVSVSVCVWISPNQAGRTLFFSLHLINDARRSLFLVIIAANNNSSSTTTGRENETSREMERRGH